ncbi:MAG: hypothetical protein MJB57_16120 [Gemmatimonadetes bacterium]|nr:hypothetical protein [Gemmatimonadota bacterium]
MSVRTEAVRMGVGMTLLAGVGLAGCASGSGGSPPTIEEAYGALSAESAVGQFLDAAKRADYQLMSRLFGTTDGPAEEDLGRIEVEQRMFVLASLLRHDSYGLRPMGITEAEGKTRVIADMVGTRNGSVSVPFIAASSRGRWFVERILTDALTGR